MKEPEIEMSYMKDPRECQKHNYSESVKILHFDLYTQIYIHLIILI